MGFEFLVGELAGPIKTAIVNLQSALQSFEGCREERFFKSMSVAALVLLLQVVIDYYQFALQDRTGTINESFPGLELLLAAIGIEASWAVDRVFSPIGTVAMDKACACNQSFASADEFLFIVVLTVMFLFAFLWPSDDSAALSSGADNATDSRLVVPAVATQHPMLSVLVSFGVLCSAAFLL